MATRPYRKDPELERLFHAYRHGDQAALSECIRRTTPWLQALARRLGAGAAEVEELVQETWQAAALAPPRDADLMTWLTALLHHRLLGARRAARRRSRLHLLDDAALRRAPAQRDRFDAAAIARGQEALRAVRSAIEDLPPSSREVLQMHLFDGMTPAEIARELGIGRVAVRVRLFRGLQRLRGMLPDALALLVVATLAQSGRSQTTRWIGLGAAAVVVAGLLVVVPTTSDAADPAPSVANAAPPPAAPVEAATEPLLAATERTAATPTPPQLAVRVLDRAGRPVASVGIVARPIAGRDPLHGSRACSDANGTAVFAAIEPGGYELATDRGAQLALHVDGTPKVAELRIDATHDVSGTVVDELGRPLAGASIWLATTPADPFAGVDVATTDADGAFLLHAVPDEALIAARAAGRGRSTARRVTPDAAMTLALPRLGGTITGTVWDWQGRPIAGACVVVGVGTDGAPPRVAGTSLPDVPPPICLLTDAAGSFSAPGIEPGNHPVVVRCAGHAPFCTTVAVDAAATVAVPVVLAEGVRLHGRLLDSRGAPCPDARVRCRSDEVFAAVDVRTAADGSFEFAGLPSGPLALWAHAADCAVAQCLLDLGPGEHRLDLRAQRLAEYRGRVTTLDGAPLAGWQVAAPDPQAPSFDQGSWFAEVGDEGAVVMHTAAVDPWSHLLIRPPGSRLWIPAADLVTRCADGTFHVGVDPTSTPAARVRLVLQDATGKRIDAAKIWLRTTTGEHLDVGTTDATGAFDFGPLFAGSYHLVCESPQPDLPPIEVPRIDVRGDEARTITCVAPPAGRLDYALRFADGTQPRAPIVSIRRVGEDLRLARLRTATGTQALTPGHYSLHAIGDDFVWIAGTEFDVVAGRTTRLERVVRSAARRTISLRNVPPECRGGMFRGRVVDRTAGIVLYRFEVPLDAAAPLPLGSFLPTGSFRIEATADSGWRTRADFELTDLAPGFTAITVPFELVP
ncbi:MAG: sigma-70 family RNA polymerase sigma factor [Planctomycetes bacterium]|nr:sigma-70 family RNA polymerase sigma factor [Planctomycetota bacterium]